MTLLRDVSLRPMELDESYPPRSSFRLFFLRGDKETNGNGELYGKSSEKVISSRRIKLIRPAVVSRAYFKCHRCSLSPPILLLKRLPPPKLCVGVSLWQGPCYTRFAMRKGRRESRRGRQRLCHTGYQDARAEDVTFDVIPGRNPERCRCRGNLSTRAYATAFQLETKTIYDVGEIGRGQKHV